MLGNLELQMKSQKTTKEVLSVDISNVEKLILGILELQIKKVLGGHCLFKLSKGGNFKKDFGKPWIR